MIRPSWSVLCRQAITDASTGSMSYINTVDHVTLPSDLPVIPYQIVIGTKWVNDSDKKEEIEVRARLVQPHIKKRKPLGASTVPIPKGPGSFNLNIEVLKLQFESSGLHYILIEFKSADLKNWKKVSELPIFISINKPTEEKGKVGKEK